MIKAFLKDKRASSGSMIAFVLLFLVAMSILFEFSRAYVIQSKVQTDIERAINSSLELAVMDTRRKDRISTTDPLKVQLFFNDYISSHMKLNSSGSYVANGATQFTVIINTIDVQSDSPANAKVSGTVSIPVKVFSGFLPSGTAMNFNFHITSRNQRFDIDEN